jgi:hypothetical protein
MVGAQASFCRSTALTSTGKTHVNAPIRGVGRIAEWLTLN